MSKLFNLCTLSIICSLFFITGVVVSVVMSQQSYNSSPEKEWILVGGVNSTSASFRVRTDGATFFLSDSESMDTTAGILFEQALGNGTMIYAIDVDTLQPNTKYYYTTRQGDVELRSGSFRTPATEGIAFDFTFAVAGCAWTGSRNDIFRQIAAREPLFMLHLGDFHYEDIAVNDMDLRLKAVDMVMGSDSQRELYSRAPLAVIWDDHDWLGNDSGESEEEPGARDTALQSYQLAFPHHPLALDGDAVPIYHAFTIGTVRFIITDLRSESTNSSIYSTNQRDWFFNELSQADQYDYVIWATSKPWVGEASTGEDNWLGQAGDRQELSAFISSTLADTQNLLVVSSDAHMLAFDNGSHTYYGAAEANVSSFPILQTGPLDRLGTVKGGPFSDGCHTIRLTRNNQYSTVSFESNGTEPCLVITMYDHEEVFQTHKLCGRIFSEPSPNTGTCDLTTASTTSFGLLGGAIALWFLLSIVCCFFLRLGESFCVSSITFIFLVSTLVTAPIPLARGIKQFDLQNTLLIAFCQMIAVCLFCGVWFCMRRKERNLEKDVAMESGDDGVESQVKGDNDAADKPDPEQDESQATPANVAQIF